MKIRQPSRLALAALLLAGCASDAWRDDKGVDGFLERIRVNCWGLRLGAVTINRLMPSVTTTDPYFLDISSRYFHHRITEQSYVVALQGAYAAPADSPGIRCILAQMPGRDAEAPPAAGR